MEALRVLIGGKMRDTLSLLLAWGVYTGAAVCRANAQVPPAPPPIPDGPRYIVTYLEVLPTAKAEALKLVRQFRDTMRSEPGNLRAEALQRLGQAHQLAFLEAWQDPAAADN